MESIPEEKSNNTSTLSDPNSEIVLLKASLNSDKIN